MESLLKVGLAVLFLLTTYSCVPENSDPINPLKADAGDPEEVYQGFSFVLNGTQSSSQNGMMMDYFWEVKDGPLGADFTIENPNEPAALFIPTKVGTYTFQLTVKSQRFSAKDWVQYQVKNNHGIILKSNAGPDQTLNQADMVKLVASATSSSANLPLTYNWEFISKPGESLVSISDPNQLITGFYPDRIGEYLLRFTVASGSVKSSDLVKVTVNKITQGAQPVILDSDIQSDRTLKNVFVSDSEKLDYLVTKDITILGGRLIVEPGVRIGFEEGTGLTVGEGGVLFAESYDSKNLPIIFQGTNLLDRHWDGISIQSVKPGTLLTGVEIRDAGRLGYGLNYSSNSILILNKSKVFHNYGIGVKIGEGVVVEKFEENNLYQNSHGPLKLPAELVSFLSSDNLIQDGPIQVYSGVLSSSAASFWSAYDSPYELLEGISVENQSTWILDPGTHLVMAINTSLRVSDGARILSKGTIDKPIRIFGKSENIGAWNGVLIKDSGLNQSVFLHTEISHAGRNGAEAGEPATLKLSDGANLKMEKTVLAHGGGNGLEAIGNEITLDFNGNIIHDHYGRPIVVASYLIDKLDYHTVMEANRFEEVAIDVSKPLFNESDETVWQGFSSKIPYVVKWNNANFLIHSGLKLLPGVTLKMKPGSSILVQNAGYLSMEGNPTDPIVIQGTFESPGSWKGIVYSTNNSLNKINYAEVHHAGMQNSLGKSAAITLGQQPAGGLTIHNSKINYSSGYGVALHQNFSALLDVANLTFEDVEKENIFYYQ